MAREPIPDVPNGWTDPERQEAFNGNDRAVRRTGTGVFECYEGTPVIAADGKPWWQGVRVGRVATMIDALAWLQHDTMLSFEADPPKAGSRPA